MLIATNRRAAQEKKFTRQGFSVAEVHHSRGAEVAFHQQFGNRKGRSLKTLLPPATAAATTK
jgi:hypothetical protein